MCLCTFKETILARVRFQGILLHHLGLELIKIILTTALTNHSRVPLYFLTLLTSLDIKVKTPRKSLCLLYNGLILWALSEIQP